MAESRGRILNVDDYVPARYARSQVLRRAGYEVIEAGTGAEALRMVAEERPDLVLLDINLPDLSGFEVCRRIREQLGTLTLPVVHVSSTFVNERAQELAFEGGSDAYLTEPVEAPVLLATVHALLRLHRAEEGLRAAGRRWQATFDAIGSGVCLLTADGAVVQCNAAFAKLCGKAAADLPGAPWAALWLTDAPTGDESSLTRLPQGKTRETIELARDGHWFRLLVDPVLEADAVAGFVCIATDITVERQVAEARAALLAREQMAREDAEAANRAKDEFLAMLGHELRNPLDVIASAVNVLDEISSKDLPAVRTRAVIHRQVRQLARLVDDLLDVGRVSTGKIILERAPVDIAEAVRRCVDTLAGAGQADRHQLEVSAEATWVEGDQSRIEQIVMNLLWNAIKYTPAGGSISIACRRRRPDGARHGHRHRHGHPLPLARAHLRAVRPGGAHARSRGGRPRHRPDPRPAPGGIARRTDRGNEPRPGSGQYLRGRAAADPRADDERHGGRGRAGAGGPANPHRGGQLRQPRDAAVSPRAGRARGARGKRRTGRPRGAEPTAPRRRAGRRRPPRVRRL